MVLAAVVLGAAACSSGAGGDSTGSPKTTRSVPASNVVEGPAPQALLEAIEWPSGLIVVGMSDNANDQLLKAVTDEPRVGPFVSDVAAIGLGEARRSVAAVLAVQLTQDAASDLAFRSTVESLLDPVLDGDAGISFVWRDSTLLVVQATEQAMLAAIATTIEEH